MDTSWKLNKNFVAALNRMEKKYGDKFMKINGFHNDNLNYSSFVDKFTEDNKLADISINPSSNTAAKDIVNLESSLTEPHMKLLAYNKLYYEITKKYGREIANEWIEQDFNGSLYMHDAPSCTFIPYCYAMDLEEVAKRGLFFIDKFKTEAPQHLTSFADHVLETVGWISNRQSGV